jgi:16S rRNA (cytosine1402-N4)-methyltransferase
MVEFKHQTVLLNEAVEYLNINPSGIYVDATLGGAGHSAKIAGRLNEAGLLIGIDQDQTAINAAQERLRDAKAPIKLFRRNFSCMTDILLEIGISKVDGILFDLGVSSPQLDEDERGFSYKSSAPLDMRMDQSQPFSAAHLVNTADAAQLAVIFWKYGEERWSKRIAGFIESYRREKPIETTGELADIIKDAIPAAARRHGPHPARRVFQALRIAVNDELNVLENALKQAVDLLKPGGRVVVISFHSLEDRIVKTIFTEKSQGCVCPKNFPICQCGIKPELKILTKKPVLPTIAEIEENPRARSSKLRSAEKLV